MIDRILVSTAWAQGATADSLWRGEGGESYLGLLLKMVLSLVLVVALVYLAFRWVFPRVFRWRLSGSPGLAVVDQMPLGGRRSVCLIRAAGKYYLLGVGDSGVGLIAELSAQDVETFYPQRKG